MASGGSEEIIDFTDALEELSPLSSESGKGSSCSHDSRSSFEEKDHGLGGLGYDLWAQEPLSIDERRDDFLRRTGLELERWRSTRQEEDRCVIDVVLENESVRAEEEEEEKESEDVGSRSGEIDKEESVDGVSVDDGCTSINGEELVKVDCLVGGSDVDVLSKPGRSASSQTFRVEEMNSILGIANWVHRNFKRRCMVDVASSVESLRKKDRKESWIKRLSFRSSYREGSYDVGSSSEVGSPAVQVNLRKKQWKELSSLYQGQDFDGHKGNIMAMKFSPDGKHLVSGGQDGAVRIWEVVQDDRSTELDVLGCEHSSLYISADGVTNADSFNKKEEGSVMWRLKKLPEKACIVAPKKFFRIAEKPLHDFHEHEGAVLDISWSERGYVLSASADKTVRLWQLGQDHCFKVFSHNDYVTCVQFNPVDENYFISGSIDGKVRLWSIRCWQVIHYIDIKEIVTAICYQPDGKGAIAGSILGNCHFYELKDNFLYLNAVVSLNSKRSSSSKIVHSFQFSPKDPSKLIVTSGDSQVRILSGVGMFCKLKGRSGRMHLSASFTVDGKYVVSASADSNVYIWHCSGTSGMSFCYRTNEIKSCESFLAENAVIAVPWHGFRALSHQLKHWSSVILPSLSDVDFNVFKDVCQKMSHSDMWGLVIVTGGSDGRIRVYHNYGLPVRP